MPDFQRVTEWRRQHAADRDDLIRAYLQHRRPTTLLHGLSRATDHLLLQVWSSHDLPAGAALVAVGGYGRGDLYPQSDIDLLILLRDELTAEEQALFEPLVALLWDLGLHVGHSVRSLSACLEESAKDVTIQTNLLEARFLAGDEKLYQAFRRRFSDAMNPAEFLDAKRLEQQQRHGRFADRALLLEPNLKDSPGGLRDIQTIAWVFHGAGFPGEFNGLAAMGLLESDETSRLTRRLGLMSRLRIHLHLIANRREDRLLFEFQEAIAADLGYQAKGSRRASELMMQHYYLAARELSLANEYLIGCLRLRLHPAMPVEAIEGSTLFQKRGSLLDIVDDSAFQQQPAATFEAFLLLQRHNDMRALTPRALRALWRSGRAINAEFRRNPVHIRQFLTILRQPRGTTLVLRLMHRLGILGRFIPLFRRITGQLQHDQFHIYPVDEHTLMVLRNLRRLTVSEFAHEYPLPHRLMTQYPRQDLLLLAALFHDIAKGRGGDHSRLGAADARRFCRRMGLEQADGELVSWLVAQHLTLSQTAQKKDLSDPDVISEFARRCGSLDRLTALYLLTVADIRGTSPKVWNAWKDKLTRELYLASRRVLEGNTVQPDSVEKRKQEARSQLQLYGYAPGSEAPLWDRLDDLYFLRQSARDIAWQTRRLLPALQNEKHIVRARLAPVGEGVEVLVFAPDEDCLFARICAFFGHLGYSILAAAVHTTGDGHALDTFYAYDPEQRQVAYRDFLNYIEHELTLDLEKKGIHPNLPSGRISRQLKAFPLEPELNLTPSEMGKDFILTFSAGDRPGLLAKIARILNEHGANVRSARISTLGNRAEDVFVLTGDALAKPKLRITLEHALIEALRL